MNSCPECGAKVAENHKFCIECGQPLAGEQAAPAAADKITGGLSNYTQYFLLHLKDPLATLRQEQVDSFVEGLASIGLFTFMMFLLFYTSVKEGNSSDSVLDLPNAQLCCWLRAVVLRAAGGLGLRYRSTGFI